MPSPERTETTLSELKDLIEEIAREGRAAVEEAERVADENVERHRSLIE